MRRIDLLEQRVRILERLLEVPSPENAARPAPGSVDEAQRRLDEAESRLSQAESQHRKGYISEAEVEASRFERDRARLMLSFSQATRDSQPTDGIAAELSVVTARYHLSVAQRRLDLTLRLAAKGFASPGDVDSHKQAVREAQQRLDQATAEVGSPDPEDATPR